MIELALYQPDIPQNTGTLIRSCAVLGLNLHIIEPCGFVWGHKDMQRAAMDYKDIVTLIRHKSWQDFEQYAHTHKKRLVLMTTKTKQSCYDFEFDQKDILIAGRESAGVPDDVHNLVDAQITIPQQYGRSLNVAIATSIITGEAIRQIRLST